MYKSMCISCGVMTDANKCPQLGYYNTIIGEWSSSLCKDCWLEKQYELHFGSSYEKDIDEMLSQQCEEYEWCG